MKNPQDNRRLMRGRKFNTEELQLKILWFLREAPAHGYELIKRFSEVSAGYYSPSPGMLYPILAQLEAQGLAQVELAGKRKIHHITAAGLAYLQQHAEQAQVLIASLKHAARKMLWMSQVNESEAAAMAATGWLPGYIEARKALQTALLMRGDADHDEQRRIIAILQRAASDIAGKTTYES